MELLQSMIKKEYFIYINFNNLSGEELDDDFEAECKKRGAGDNTKISIVVPIATLTGHSGYLVKLEGVEEKLVDKSDGD